MRTSLANQSKQELEHVGEASSQSIEGTPRNESDLGRGMAPLTVVVSIPAEQV
jgi:hypothetical protein